jgi:hypothetical protein
MMGNPFAGLDRKKMEEERLARANRTMVQEKGHNQTNEKVKKRKPSASPPRDEDREYRIPKIARLLTTPSASSGIQFPNGVVKRTWVSGCPRSGDDIKIEEVLQKNDLELAVLSAFQVDSEWIMNKLDDKTKVVWILQAKTEAEVS